jgi:stalled ribosome alternative rescue factor ArfA
VGRPALRIFTLPRVDIIYAPRLFGRHKGAFEMKYRLTRKETAPPNLAAKALRHGLFRPKVEKNPDAYSRKQKHKKGSLDDVHLPFLLDEEDKDRPGEPDETTP